MTGHECSSSAILIRSTDPNRIFCMLLYIHWTSGASLCQANSWGSSRWSSCESLHTCPTCNRPANQTAQYQLVDLCLAALDPKLHSHLLSFNLKAELYAFPSLLTFCASTPPLGEVLELWDFLLAWGVGLNVLCVAGQLWLMRESLLESSSWVTNQRLSILSVELTDLETHSPMKLLRTFPALRSGDIIPLVVQFIGDLDDELYSAVVRHPWDDTLNLERT